MRVFKVCWRQGILQSQLTRSSQSSAPTSASLVLLLALQGFLNVFYLKISILVFCCCCFEIGSCSVLLVSLNSMCVPVGLEFRGPLFFASLVLGLSSRATTSGYFYFIDVYVLSVATCTCIEVLEEARGVRSPEISVNRWQQAYQYCQKLNLGLLQEQYLFFIAKLSLQPEYVICSASILRYFLTCRWLGVTHFLTYIEICNCIYCCEASCVEVRCTQRKG